MDSINRGGGPANSENFQSANRAENGEAKSSSADAKELSSSHEDARQRTSAFKGLGWLDRYLAVWILLAMIIGVLLGNFVPETGPALQKGQFVGVSVPIGLLSLSVYPRRG